MQQPPIIDLIRQYYDALRGRCRDAPKHKIPTHRQTNTTHKPTLSAHGRAITAYGKSYCPYSNKAKALLAKMGSGMYIDMESDSYKPLTPKHAVEIDKSTTIPIVFVQDEYIGGFEALEKLFT